MRGIRRLADQSGSTLVLIIGVVAALAVLAATLVMVTVNTQGATAANRTQVTAFDYAEAGLNSAVAGVGSSWPSTSDLTFSDAALTAALVEAYPDADTRPDVDITAYDNLDPVDKSVEWDSNNDGVMWVESRCDLSAKVAAVRTQIQRQVTETSGIFPGVAVYSGGDVSLSGTGQIGNVALTQDAAIYAVGNLTRTDQTCLRIATTCLGGSEVIPDWMVGDETWLDQPAPAAGGEVVPSLSSFVPDSTVESWISTAGAADANGVIISQPNAGTGDYTCPYAAAKYVGSLTLGSSSGTTPLYTFNSLYVTGDFTVNADALTKIDNLYVGGSLTVTAGAGGDTTVEQDWGNVLVQGDVSISGNQFCQIDLLVTYGNASVGSGAKVGGDGEGTNATPTLFALVGEGKTFTGSGSGNAIFYGVLYNRSGDVVVSSGSGAAFEVNNGVVSMESEPFIRGAIFAAGDVTISGGASVAYDASVVENVQTGGTVPVTQIVPNTWQELPAN